MRQILMESDMHIPYEDEACYMIEKSPSVAKLQGVKIVEFVQANGKKHIKMVEAKTTAPCQGNTKDYGSYLRDIREKFQNSISLLNAAKMKRREEIYEELPQPLKDVDYKKAVYQLILVIKHSQLDWLASLTADLRRELHPFLKCWNIPDANFFVLNEELARELKFVE